MQQHLVLIPSLHRDAVLEETSRARVQSDERLGLPIYTLDPKVAHSSRPMMEVEAGSNIWYQAHVLKESKNEMRVLFPGATPGLVCAATKLLSGQCLKSSRCNREPVMQRRRRRRRSGKSGCVRTAAAYGAAPSPPASGPTSTTVLGGPRRAQRANDGAG